MQASRSRGALTLARGGVFVGLLAAAVGLLGPDPGSASMSQEGRPADAGGGQGEAPSSAAKRSMTKTATAKGKLSTDGI